MDFLHFQFDLHSRIGVCIGERCLLGRRYHIWIRVIKPFPYASRELYHRVFDSLEPPLIQLLLPRLVLNLLVKTLNQFLVVDTAAPLSCFHITDLLLQIGANFGHGMRNLRVHHRFFAEAALARLFCILRFSITCLEQLVNVISFLCPHGTRAFIRLDS